METILITITVGWLYLFIGFIIAGFIAKCDINNLFSEAGEINIGFVIIWPILVILLIVTIPFVIVDNLFNK